MTARLALAACGLGLALALAEGAARLADGGALPQLPLYATAPDGRIVLAADAEARVRRPDGAVYTARTLAHGLRAPAARPGAWLVVGDSQVFGSGVADDEAFPARLGAHNAGVPGYGLPDALARAEALLPTLRPAGVYVVVDQANDWDDGLAPLHTRHAVRGGWLLTAARAAAPGAWAWDTPLARLHLFYLLQVRALTPPAPAAPAFLAPDPATTRAFADALRAFARAHPDTRTVAVWLPVDAATSEARARRTPFDIGARTPWTDTSLRDALRDALAGEVPLVDLLPALADPDSFLDRDFHLSEAGHAAVAARLAAEAP